MSRKILVAEDDLFQANIILTLLKQIHCEVILAKNGREAVDLFTQHQASL